MIKELDDVVLAVDLPKHKLVAGDMGTVVLVHKNGGFEVEFMTLDGTTVAVTSLSSEEVRSTGAQREIAHARVLD